MTIRTRLNYRNDVKDKILSLEDSGYGDFEFSDAEYDTYLDLAVARLFPSIFKHTSVSALAPTEYGTQQQGYVQDDAIAYDRVYLVEDADEYAAIVGWQTRPDRIIGIDTGLYTSCNVYWIDPYVLPTNDVDPTGIPFQFEPLINLGALIEALESRQDTGVKGDPTTRYMPFIETQLMGYLKPRYDALKMELAMSMPGMKF
ncbi:MAG: hypothetical protein ACXVGB_00345 [Mycobacteriaceae bacterium]